MTQLKEKSIKKIFSKAKSQRVLIFMTIPAFLSYLAFSYFPLFGWSLAFINYKPGVKLFQNEFVGLKYFVEFFTETNDAGLLIRNTLAINILSILSIFIFSIIFSIMLSEARAKRFSRGVQMVSLFPFFLSWIIGYSLIYAMFSMETGAINALLVNLGIIKSGINVLGSPQAAWPMMIMLNTWKNLGYYSIIFLSTIMSIPLEQYEAACIDGAGRIQVIWHITLKNLKSVFFVMLILQSGTILSSNLEQFFAFTNSQNWDRMITFDMYVYQYGLARAQYSFATAVGIIRSVISIALLLSVNALSKKYADQSVL